MFYVRKLDLESSKAIASAALAVFLVARGDEMAAATAEIVAASMRDEVERKGPGGAVPHSKRASQLNKRACTRASARHSTGQSKRTGMRTPKTTIVQALEQAHT